MQNLFLEQMIPRNKTISSSNSPYQACLIPSLPEDLQHQVRDISNYIVVPLDMLLAVMSFVCNTLVFITITRTKSLRHPSLLMLCSLSITDLLWALTTVITKLFVLLDPHMCPKVSREELCIGIFCFLATLSNLAVISRDRYLAISRPAWYRGHVSRSRARVVRATLFSWLSSMLTSLIVYAIFKTEISYFKPVISILIFLFYVVYILIILFNYVKFFIANRQHSRNMRMQLGNMRVAVEKEKQLSRAISLILLCFLFSFLPAVISPVVVKALKLPIRPFQAFMSLLFTLNGLLNPLLNCGRNREIRRAMLHILRCQHGRIGPKLPAVTYNRNAQKKNNNSVNGRDRHLQQMQIKNN